MDIFSNRVMAAAVSDSPIAAFWHCPWAVMFSPGSWTLSLARFVCSGSVFIWQKGFHFGIPFILHLYCGHAKCKCIGSIWSFLFFKSYTWFLPADLSRGGLLLSYSHTWLSCQKTEVAGPSPLRLSLFNVFYFAVSKKTLGKTGTTHVGQSRPLFWLWQAQSLLWLNGDSLDWKLLLWGRQSRKCCGGSWSPSQYLNTEDNRQKAPLSQWFNVSEDSPASLIFPRKLKTNSPEMVSCLSLCL